MTTETREEIVKKIDAKESAVGKLRDKSVSLDQQVEMYKVAIVNAEKKIANLRDRIAKFEESKTSVDAEVSEREEEIAHMNGILEQFDSAEVERQSLAEELNRMIDAHEWKPGMADSLRVGSISSTPEYKEKLKRKQTLDTLVNEALSDVRKIYFSRGKVSGYFEVAKKE